MPRCKDCKHASDLHPEDTENDTFPCGVAECGCRDYEPELMGEDVE